MRHSLYKRLAANARLDRVRPSIRIARLSRTMGIDRDRGDDFHSSRSLVARSHSGSDRLVLPSEFSDLPTDRLEIATLRELLNSLRRFDLACGDFLGGLRTSLKQVTRFLGNLLPKAALDTSGERERFEIVEDASNR